MNKIILSAIVNHVVPLLEEEFSKNEPAIQSALVHDATALALKIDAWAKSKIETQKGN